MARSGWFNDNRNRSFPFLHRTVGEPADGPLTLLQLPDDIVIDAGFVMGSKSRFHQGEHAVYLSKIRRVSDTFFFEFESDAPELLGVPLIFTRHVGDEDYLTEHTDTGDAGLSESGSTSGVLDSCEEPLWSGYMVSGNMASLELFLPGNGEVSRSGSAATVEPALVHSLAGAYVNSLNIANDDRTRVTATEGCDEVAWPYDTGVIFVNQRCLVGEIIFKAGYNATVRQSNQENSITLGAAVGEGEGQPCGEVKLFDAEVPPAGSNLLAGGPQCNEVLRSINGQGGRLFNLIAKTGVTITSLPEENRLVVDINMSGLALCFDDLSQVSESV